MAVSHFVLLKNGYFAQFGAGYFFGIEDFGKVVWVKKIHALPPPPPPPLDPLMIVLYFFILIA